MCEIKDHMTQSSYCRVIFVKAFADFLQYSVQVVASADDEGAKEVTRTGSFSFPWVQNITFGEPAVFVFNETTYYQINCTYELYPTTTLMSLMLRATISETTTSEIFLEEGNKTSTRDFGVC